MAGSEVLALVPARQGSRGVPQKNIRLLGGYPLLAYAIVAGRISRGIDRVIVSTDSTGIAAMGEKFGAWVPFLRPAELAGDRSPDIDFVLHALHWLRDHGEEVPALIVNLRPTTPLRDPELVGSAVQRMRESAEATALRSVHQVSEPPQKLMGMADGYLTGLFPQDPRPEYYNLPRQAFPPAYHPNGYVDIYRSDHILAEGTLHGPRVIGFITPPVTEVDSPEDLDYLDWLIRKKEYPIQDHLQRLFPGNRRTDSRKVG